ncbi:MAG TPA: carboxypeptidase regulatory-like domain-containing protein [Acidobacteriaceae bacterium]|nr:carboxypeptidase regulatory-like domain-containing protein [Acidobacteriaceae bacterium]
MTLWKRWLCLAIAALCFVFVASAQENATLTGSVTDPSGAVVPNAKVTLTNSATGEIRAGTTNGAGLYEFAALHIGSYNLRVAASGFETYEKSGIVMNVAATVREDVQLAVGASTTTVTVQANSLHLQTDTNEISNLVTGEQISEIALNGRNMISLTTLGTGVSANNPSFNGVSAQGSSENISFNGMRLSHNNWLIDGGEVYDRGSGGRPGVMPSPDVLAEFQTLDSNYAADYGIASGGTMVMALKSGTKNFHGGVWEFNRNDAFDAEAYFSKQSHQPTPELRLNIFGGDIGGPVFIPGLYPKSKSRTFFFYSEEWRRFIQGANPTATATIPAGKGPFANINDIPESGKDFTYVLPPGFKESPNAGACNAGQTAPCVPNTADPAKLSIYTARGLTIGNSFPGNVIPKELLDPNAILFMHTGAIPAANAASAANGAPQYIASPKQPTFVREDVVRADHDITPRLHLMGHWIHDQMTQTIYPAMWDSDSYVTTGNVFNNPSWGTVIKLTDTISPTLLNETSINVNGNSIRIPPAGIYKEPSGWTQTGYFPAANNLLSRMPRVGFGAPLGTTWNVNYWPWQNAWLNYQPRDDLSWTKAKHELKFGFAYMRGDKNQQQQADTQGDYAFGTDFSGDSYVNFLLGMADSFTQLQRIDMFHWINNTWSFYGMDNWHVAPRLTLNLGFRYDAMPHTYEKFNRTANFVPSLFSTANEQIPDAKTGTLNPNGPGFSNPTNAAVPFYLNGIGRPGVNGFPRNLVKSDFFTLQPRLGFAYDVFGTGKTILRAGAGIFYERVQGNDVYGTDTNPPYAYRPTANSVYYTNPRVSAIDGSVASNPVFPAGIGTLSYYYPDPATAQYSLGVQHQLQPGIVALVQYVGTGGWNQSDTRHINTLPLGDITHRQAVSKGANANLYRQFPGWADISQDENAATDNYNSMQAALRIENRHGVSAQFAYTWSHSIGVLNDDLGGISNPFNLRYDRGPTNLDRRHIFNANYIYHLPSFRSNGMFERTVLGNWTFSGVTTIQSGVATDVTYGTDTLGLGGGTTNRPDLVGKVAGPKTQKQWFNTAAFAAPLAPWAGGTNNGFGTAGRNAVVGPGLQNWNLSLFKAFPLTENENTRFEFRVESFNTFNHTQFNGLDTGKTDSNFGQVTSANDPRVLQFGGKFLF